MGSVSLPFNIQGTDTKDISQVMANLQAIVDEVNGSLQASVNVAVASAVTLDGNANAAGSSSSLARADHTHQVQGVERRAADPTTGHFVGRLYFNTATVRLMECIDDDPATYVPARGAAVATTVAGLAPVYEGKQGLLRVGSTPFEFLAVTYDATLAKWVSAPVAQIATQLSTFAVSEAAYVPASPLNVSRAFIANAKALYDAGMRPQVFTAARMANNGANTTFARAAVYELADGDTAATVLGAAAEVSHLGTTATWKVSTVWETVTVTPVDAHWQLVIEHKQNAGTGTYTDTQAQMRWVSA